MSFEYEIPEECFLMTFCFCSDVSLGFHPTLPEVVPLIIRSSFAVCSKLREHADTLILIVSSRTGKEDKLNGFDLGADDYIEKPYDIDILIAKIKGIFKRRYQRDTLSADGVTLNFADKTAVIDGKSVELPAKEFELLALLIGNQGKTLRKEYLFGTVWGSDNNSELQTLHVHINRLRQKLGDDPKNTKRLLTVWGVGYKFV